MQSSQALSRDVSHAKSTDRINERDKREGKGDGSNSDLALCGFVIYTYTRWTRPRFRENDWTISYVYIRAYACVCVYVCMRKCVRVSSRELVLSMQHGSGTTLPSSNQPWEIELERYRFAARLRKSSEKTSGTNERWIILGAPILMANVKFVRINKIHRRSI